jgi:hypothetical protein
VRSQETQLKRLKAEKEELMKTNSEPGTDNTRYVPTYLRERELVRRERAGDRLEEDIFPVLRR